MSPTASPASARTLDRSFERLYRHHRPAVYGLVLRDLRDPDEAEDATQATFLNAYRALRRGDAPERPRAWLLAIARNVCRRRFRTRLSRPREVELEPELCEALAGYDGPSAAEIRVALERLTPKHRAVILLREFWGLSYEEIGHRLDLSQSAVETLLFRARRRLREELETVDDAPARTRGLLVIPLPPSLVTWLDSLVLTLSRSSVVARAAGVLAAAAIGTGVAIETGADAAQTAAVPATREPAEPAHVSDVADRRVAPRELSAAVGEGERAARERRGENGGRTGREGKKQDSPAPGAAAAGGGAATGALGAVAGAVPLLGGGGGGGGGGGSGGSGGVGLLPAGTPVSDPPVSVPPVSTPVPVPSVPVPAPPVSLPQPDLPAPPVEGPALPEPPLP